MTRIRRWLLATAGLVAVSVATSAITFAAFSQTTDSAANSFAVGTVQLGDNDTGNALLGLTDAVPGTSDSGCVTVTYSGTLPAAVRLYGSSSGALAPYLTLTVTRGVDPAPSFDSCSSFVADASDYIGQGAGVVYAGSLANYPSTYAGGVLDPPSAASTWTSGTSRTYKLTVTLDDVAAAAGSSAAAVFTFEARNE